MDYYLDKINTEGIRLTKSGVGLNNYGNTCFLNAGLQAISSSPLIKDFIANILKMIPECCYDKYHYEIRLLHELHRILMILSLTKYFYLFFF